MIRYWSILLIILITHQLSAQDEGNIILLKEQLTKYGQAEIEFTLPDLPLLNTISSNISVFKIKGKVVSANVSLRDTLFMADFPLPYTIIQRAGLKAVQSALSVEEAMAWDLYPTYQQYDSIMKKLVLDYPDLCKLYSIGESVNGRQVMVLKISDNVDMEEDEAEVLYSSTMHGDELVGFVLMLRLSEHLLSNATNGSIEQQLVDSLEIWINPNANPDGTYYGGDTISGPIRYNANFVDLNREFPDPEQGVYTPIAAAKENIDMVEFLTEHNFVISANFHSGVEVVNFPWDKWYDPHLHADHIWFDKISRSYADTVHKYSTNPFYFTDFDDGVTHGASWLKIEGGRQDYVTYERQGREVTIELDETKETPASELHWFWDSNYRSLLYYLSNAFYGIHAKVVDNDTGLPVEARVFIQGHDIDSSHVYSEAVNGSFVRLIDEGVWNLAVSADTYETLYLTNIQVTDRQQTRLEIRLHPDGTGINDTLSDQLKIWPVPADELLNIQLPQGFGINLIASVYNINGTEIYKMPVSPDSDSLLKIDIKSLSKGIYIIKLSNSISGKTMSGRFIKI